MYILSNVFNGNDSIIQKVISFKNILSLCEYIEVSSLMYVVNKRKIRTQNKKC